MLNPFICEFDLAIFFIDNEEQFRINFGHFSVVVLHVLPFGFLQELPNTFLTQKLDECLVFWQSSKSAEEHKSAVNGIALGDMLFRISQDRVDILPLVLYKLSYFWLELGKFVSITLWYRTRDNQWCSCIVDQDRVNLIHNCVVVNTLYHIFS